MGVVEHAEVELKFEADADTAIPDLPAELVAGEAVVADLSATYFDTDTLVLSRAKITLRRRTGGSDDGWHIKLPAQAGARTELQAPLTEGNEPPDELLDRVRVFVRDQPLRPIARIDNHRTTWLVTQGADTAELCDDLVTATSLLTAEAAAQSWREWEVELVSGETSVLAALSQVLLGAGATTSNSPSKLARAIGPLPPVAAPEPPAGSAAQLLLGVLGKHIGNLAVVDPQVRADAPDAVHQFRVTVRRIRSILRSYRAHFDAASLESFDSELRWLATTMGDARDSEVMAERIAAIVADMPEGVVPRELSDFLVGGQLSRYRSAHDSAVEGLSSPRYYRLLDSLDSLLAAPVLTDKAHTAAGLAVYQALGRQDKQMRRTHHAIVSADNAAHRDELLHSLRKQAKRMRYAGEVYAGAAGDAEFLAAVAEVAGAAKALQETLGDHQDGVITQVLLQSARKQRPQEERAAFKALIAHERELARTARKQYPADLAAMRQAVRHMDAAAYKA